MPAVRSQPRKPKARSRATRTGGAALPFWRRALLYLSIGIVCVYGTLVSAIFSLRWVNPLTTAVQAERRFSALASGERYQKRYRFIALSEISPYLLHAVIAAEDTRFFEHHGFDWQEVGTAIRQDLEEGRRRGASTLTQQLVRNLFLSTSPSLLRKLAEFTLVPPTEALLSKRRILELYLNVVEWGPGVFGAEAASETYFHVPARLISREQAVQLASVLPAPLHRKPGQVQRYALRIKARMQAMHW